MQDMTALLAKELKDLARAMEPVQVRIESLLGNQDITLPKEVPTDAGLLLKRRKNVLAKLGMDRKVGRASWSHDRGDAIIFDAWDDMWEDDGDQNPYYRYPMRGNKHYVLAESKANPNRGHTRWQYHVDLVLSGQRSALTIMPVRSSTDSPNRRTRGWLPQYATGEIKLDDDEYWFYADQVFPV